MKSMAQVLDETLNAVEALQKPSPKGLTGKLPNFVALSRQATSLPSKVRLAEQFSGQPELS